MQGGLITLREDFKHRFQTYSSNLFRKMLVQEVWALSLQKQKLYHSEFDTLLKIICTPRVLHGEASDMLHRYTFNPPDASEASHRRRGIVRRPGRPVRVRL